MGRVAEPHQHYLIEDRDTGTWWTPARQRGYRHRWRDLFATNSTRPGKGRICTPHAPDHHSARPAHFFTKEFHCPFYITRAEYYRRAFASAQCEQPVRTRLAGRGSSTAYGIAGGLRPKLARDSAAQYRVPGSDAAISGGAGPPRLFRLQDGDTLTIGDHDWQVVVGPAIRPNTPACIARASASSSREIKSSRSSPQRQRHPRNRK